MKQLALISITAAVSALLLVPGALAKGASEATITGPGLESPLTFPGEGGRDGELLMAIAQQTGFLVAVFGPSPGPMFDARPPGDLGPRYLVRYRMPGPNNELDTLVQELYPYATPRPVSYTKPGQRFWTTKRTHGGWYVASDELRELLTAAGLPESPPAGGGDSNWPLAGVLAALAAALVLASVLVLGRRPHTSTTTASRSAS